MTHVVRPMLGAAGLLLLISVAARAESHDELIAENAALHARIAALELQLMEDEHAADVHQHGHEHDEPAAHDHNGHAGHGHGGGRQDQQSHGNGHGNGHGHADLERCEPFHHRHETSQGYMLLHMLKTEHAWLEREVVFDLGFANGADGGTVDETELEVEFEYAINSHVMLILGQPVIFLDPDEGEGLEGIGDLEAGFQYLAFDGERTIVSFGLNASLPTGDEDKGLGAGNVLLAPRGLLWHDFCNGTHLHAEAAFDVPVDVDQPENALVYNVALSHTIAASRCWDYMRHLTPLVEANCETMLNGPESGTTVVNLTPGVRWIVGKHHQAGFGYSFPVTGSQQFEGQWLFSFILHLGE
jgi:hypothetical protein